MNNPKFKVGDRVVVAFEDHNLFTHYNGKKGVVVFVNSHHSDHIYRIEFLNYNSNSFYEYKIVSEDVYNSPLYKLMQEN